MSLYDLKTNTLLGKPADLGAYRGKVTLVVNVASKCGYTPQYEGLEKLHRELQGKGFAVLGFPSNDFGEQEPGTAQEIAEFCRLTYDVTFPMFAKVVTLPGPRAVADLRVPRRRRRSARLEFQQVPGRQGRQGDRIFPERGGARVTRASSRDREGARGELRRTHGPAGSRGYRALRPEALRSRGQGRARHIQWSETGTSRSSTHPGRSRPSTSPPRPRRAFAGPS